MKLKSVEIKKAINNMSLEEKIGQLIIAGFTGYEINDHISTLIDKYKLGNINLLTRNFKSIEQFHNLVMELYEKVYSSTNIMPFISITQEGGMVTRINKEATFFPGNMTIAATDQKNTYEVGRLMGEELLSLGINLDFAPSLDVNNNPANPVIGVRSYSDDPEIVAKMGENFINGLQSTGVIAIAKHFPGHGDTDLDSHFNLPTINKSIDELLALELVPFKRVSHIVKGMMPAHIVFEQMDNVPITVSKKVITELLKGKIGFDGLIISDCMEMKAIANTITTPIGVVKALQAGQDQVIISSTIDAQISSIEEVKKAVNDGRLSLEEINRKVEKVLTYKNSLVDIVNSKFLEIDYQEKEKILLNKYPKEFVQKIVDNSLTKVKGNKYYCCFNTLVIAPSPFAMTVAEEQTTNRSIIKEINDSLNEDFKVDTLLMNVNLTISEIDNILLKAKRYEQVVICTYNAYQFTNQALLVNKLYDAINKLYVISLKNPYDILKFKQIENYLCLYEYTPTSVKTITKFLKGDLQPVGKLPVSLNEKITCGASIYVGLDEYPLSKNLEYLDMLKENGIDRVFISAHIPEMKPSFKQELEEVCSYADSLGIKIIMDVSKPMMNSFKMPKVYSLRLDYGFSDEEILELSKSKDFFIEFNASTITENKIIRLKNIGVDFSKVRISHNFYPKKYTGLDRNEVIKRNNIFKKYGIKVMLYIPSNNEHRPPMYEGLPTIEAHRSLRMEAILSEIRSLGIDEVFIGDSYASKEELQMIKNFDYETITIPIIINDDLSNEEITLLEKTHYNRIDQPIYFKRSSCRIDGVIKPHNQIERKTGYITIDNSLFKRYQGEVCIMTKDLEKDERVNVVGKIACDIETVNFIKPQDKFKLLIINKVKK